MKETTSKGEATSDPRAEAELLKLYLEIENLRYKNKWEGRTSVYLPLLTVIVAVAGFLFGVYQFQSQQKLQQDQMISEQQKDREARAREQNIRIQGQIRVDKEQAQEFIGNDKISTVRVAFLLSDLNGLIAQLPEREPETQGVTELLTGIAWTLRFDEQRHIDFDVLALKRWADYRKFWGSNPGPHHVFLAQKYYPSMSRIYTQDRECVEKLDYNEEASRYLSERSNKGCQDGLFPILLYGFREHLEVFKETNNRELLSKEIEAFSQLTNNSAFAKRLSAIYLTSNN